jgi:hypothetical protein
MNRMDNLQIVFDRSDWELVRAQRAALALANDEADVNLWPLMHWLDALLDAAKMDGFQTKETTQ